ncbi:MAG: sigma-70 family RNA polymerase sigma factor [Planctomycetota bacterium]|nr:MAG: sigma-70 family RNA polymerase sigma factor [Planctomycetota bacterium]
MLEQRSTEAARPEPEADAARAAREEENALVARAREGDESAFRALVDRYRKRIYWVAYNMVGDEQDAIDITQEAFVRVFKSLDRFDPRYRFYTWLYRIVSNLSVDLLRKRGTRRNVSLDDVGDMQGNGIGAHEQLERAELGQRVRAVLDRLPPPYREVMVLRELNGLSAKEIAELVGSTHATVRWRLHRARKLFRDEWESLYGDGSTGGEATR